MVGGIGGAIGGAFGGGAVGGAAGSVVPVVGNVAGAAIGGVGGTVSGGYAGGKAGKSIGRNAFNYLWGSDITNGGEDSMGRNTGFGINNGQHGNDFMPQWHDAAYLIPAAGGALTTPMKQLPKHFANLAGRKGVYAPAYEALPWAQRYAFGPTESIFTPKGMPLGNAGAEPARNVGGNRFNQEIGRRMQSGLAGDEATAQKMFNQYADYNLNQAQQRIQAIPDELAGVQSKLDFISSKARAIGKSDPDGSTYNSALNMYNKYYDQYADLTRELAQHQSRLPGLQGLRPASGQQNLQQKITGTGQDFWYDPSNLKNYRESLLNATDGTGHQFTTPAWEQASQLARGRMFAGTDDARAKNLQSLGAVKDHSPELRGLYSYAQDNVPGLKLPDNPDFIRTPLTLKERWQKFLGEGPKPQPNSIASASHYINGRVAPEARPLISSTGGQTALDHYYNQPHEVQHVHDMWRALRQRQKTDKVKEGPQFIVGSEAEPLHLQNIAEGTMDRLLAEFNANANVKKQMPHWLAYKDYPLDAAKLNQSLDKSMSSYFDPSWLQRVDATIPRGFGREEPVLSGMKKLREQYPSTYFENDFKNYDAIIGR